MVNGSVYKERRTSRRNNLRVLHMDLCDVQSVRDVAHTTLPFSFQTSSSPLSFPSLCLSSPLPPPNGILILVKRLVSGDRKTDGTSDHEE